jgi:putative ABC transport system permease protein
MNFGEILRTVLVEIRSHPLRSTLTLLGIILGTLSITVMASFLDGVVSAVWQGFDDLGFDGVMVVVNRGPRDLREQSIFARSSGLRPEDGAVILARRQLVSQVAPVAQEELRVRRGGVERRVRVLGVTPSYAEARNRRVAAGRFINDLDLRTFSRVCVIGHRLKARLFGSEDALGKTLQLAGRGFRVIGVGHKLGNAMFDEEEFTEEMEGLYIPLSTLRKLHTGDGAPLAFLAVKTDRLERLGDFKAEVTASLRLAHRGAEDFEVENVAEEILRARQEVTGIIRNWRIVLGSIAGISLLVGGIGLLSVMLISIGERLYEIGLRKAIGATDAEIFAQFLVESVLLSAIGGLVGAGLGIGVIGAVAAFFPSGLPVRVGGLALALGTAVVLGAVYGIYPALRASRLEPVDALRSAG